MEAQFADVIDDRIGTRVGMLCWAAADPLHIWSRQNDLLSMLCIRKGSPAHCSRMQRV